MWLVWVLLASVGFGAGAALQKHGMATRLPNLAVRDLWQRPRQVVRTALSNRLWLAGGAANLTGAAALVLALHAGELSVVQPLTNLNLVVSVLAGVLVLRERLVRAEQAAIAVLVAGAVLVSISGLRGAAADAVPSLAALAVAAGACGAAVLLLTVLGRAPGARRHPELALGLAAGLLYGLGAVCMKVLLLELDAVAGRSLAGLVAALGPALVGVALANLAAYALEQVAFSQGRVAMVDPLCTGGGLVMSVAFGVYGLGERLDLARTLGLVLLVGALMRLMWRPSRARAPGGAMPAAAGVAK